MFGRNKVTKTWTSLKSQFFSNLNAIPRNSFVEKWAENEILPNLKKLSQYDSRI